MTASEIKRLSFDIRDLFHNIFVLREKLYSPGTNKLDVVVSGKPKKNGFADSIAKLETMNNELDNKLNIIYDLLDTMPYDRERSLICDIIYGRDLEDLGESYCYQFRSKKARREHLNIMIDQAFIKAAACHENGYTKDLIMEKIEHTERIILLVKDDIKKDLATPETLRYFQVKLDNYKRKLTEN